MRADKHHKGMASAISDYFLVMGELEQAMAQAEMAHELDAFSTIGNFGVGWNLYLARRYDEAIEQALTLLELIPDDPWGHALLEKALAQKGRYSEAVQRATGIVGNFSDPTVVEALDRGFEEAGYPGAWNAAAQALEVLSSERYVSPGDVAVAYTRAQDREKALDWLERAVEARDPLMVYLSLEPEYDDLRSNPRFEALVRRVGL